MLVSHLFLPIWSSHPGFLLEHSDPGQSLTLWCGEVDDVAVRLEHVDLLNGLDGLDVHLLEGGLKLLVVDTRGLVDLLEVSSGSTLATVHHMPTLADCSDSSLFILSIHPRHHAFVCVDGL